MDRLNERVVQLNSDKCGLVDLSSGGAALLCSLDLSQGSSVVLEIENIVIQSSVVYCKALDNGFRVGVKFIKMDSTTQNTLETIVGDYSKGVPYNCKIRQIADVLQ